MPAAPGQTLPSTLPCSADTGGPGCSPHPSTLLPPQDLPLLVPHHPPRPSQMPSRSGQPPVSPGASSHQGNRLPSWSPEPSAEEVPGACTLGEILRAPSALAHVATLTGRCGHTHACLSPPCMHTNMLHACTHPTQTPHVCACTLHTKHTHTRVHSAHANTRVWVCPTSPLTIKTMSSSFFTRTGDSTLAASMPRGFAGGVDRHTSARPWPGLLPGPLVEPSALRELGRQGG